ncbi:MAG: 2-C-methyl-D-erythritol 2,4-cyclodiphosphate synthase [Gammaproteobacteria bacterium]|nr:MAG: 2-C-methyl-D-erythritol 2,4-cyclodiphosphate synthase [Gammaproteobacteria bacterium]
MRIGQGFDAHRFCEASDDRPLVIGGVVIPHDRGLLAHSDGDVAIHALCDALLGAAGLPDIGHFFPDTDQRYKGVDSTELLAKVVAELEEAGWQIENVDLTIIAQAPKISPWITDMKKSLADLLRVSSMAVGVKATTSEGMGFTGRAEGIATLAVALLTRN